MAYYDYEYLREGFMNPVVMWIMVAIIAVLLIITIKIWSKDKKNLWRELKDNRFTIRAMVNKNIIGKYSNCYIGILWNILMPAIIIAAICVTFLSIKNLYPDRYYCIYLCSGFFIASACRNALMGRTFRNNSAMLKKMSTPGWTIVFADTIVNMITLMIAIVIQLVAIFIIAGFVCIPSIATLPILIPILFAFCFGCSLLVSTVSVLSNDIGNLVISLARIIVWITPTFYYLYDSNTTLQTASMWNPFTYFVELEHQVMSYGVWPNFTMLIAAILITIITLLVGAIVYNIYIGKVRESI